MHEETTSRRICRALVENLKAVVESSGAAAIFVYADALAGEQLPLPAELREKVIYIAKTQAEQRELEERGARFLRVPNVALSRMGQVKIAVFLALSRKLVRRGDIAACLTGLPASGALDTLIITEVGAETEMFASQPGEESLPKGLLPEVVERVIGIAAALGSEGREGKPVGALFVIGDSQRVVTLSRQLILNPFHGYSEEVRNVLDPNLEETVKELSTIDGAFIISGEGVLATCGAYLQTTPQDEEADPLPRGWGARHHAAAGITAATEAIAVSVSESTGTVTVFRNGHIVTEIEKSRAGRRRGFP
ncbi:MAG: diadenylate cyclase [Planctomycetes bacterium]|nr:diadenylate cyclase [Planctomycetota bacterium]